MAIFTWRIIENVIVIYDLHDEENQSVTVTNDIENVILLINENLQGIGNRKVIYRDTNLIYDEVVIDDNQFLKFNPLNEQSYLKAIEMVKK